MEPIGIGAGIIIGCTILGTIFGIITILFRIFPAKKNNPGNPGNSSVEKRFNAIDEKFKTVRYGDTCDEIVKRLEGLFRMLKGTVDTGFQNMNKQLGEIRKGLK